MSAATDQAVAPAKTRSMKALPGRRVTAEIENDRLILGSSRLMEEEGIERGPLAARAEEQESDGRSVSWIAATQPKKRMIGLLPFCAEAKNPANAAIAHTHRLVVTTTTHTVTTPR